MLNFLVSAIHEGYLGQSTYYSARLPSQAQLQLCTPILFDESFSEGSCNMISYYIDNQQNLLTP